MAVFSRVRSFWRNTVHRRAVDRDLDEELSGAHAELTEEYIRRGMDPDAASRCATIELGHTHAVAERIRDARAGASLESFLQDLRYGARLLRRSPLFTATAILSLGLGIGANTTIFSLVNALLLRELRVTEPDRLVEIGATIPTGRGKAQLSAAFSRCRRTRSQLRSKTASRNGPGASSQETSSTYSACRRESVAHCCRLTMGSARPMRARLRSSRTGCGSGRSAAIVHHSAQRCALIT